MCICIYIGTRFLFVEGPPRHFSFLTRKSLKRSKNAKNCPKTPKTALFPSRNLLVGIGNQNTDPLQNLSKLTQFWPFWTVFGVSLRKHGRLYRVPLTKTGEAYFGPKLTSGNDFFDHFWGLLDTFGHFWTFLIIFNHFRVFLEKSGRDVRREGEWVEWVGEWVVGCLSFRIIA